MGFSNYEVAKRWSEGLKATGCSMFTDGITVWSYGEHFPIAVRVKNKVFFNKDRYSNSTSKHQYEVKRFCPEDTVFVNTEQIKRIVNYPDEPVVIIKEVIPMNHEKIIDALGQFCRSKGMKRFPKKKYIKQIEQMIFVNNI